VCVTIICSDVVSTVSPACVCDNYL